MPADPTPSAELNRAIQGMDVSCLLPPRESTPEPPTCRWTEDGDWETACGNGFIFIEDGPAENDFKFCPYCGKAIEAIPYAEPADAAMPAPPQEARHA